MSRLQSEKGWFSIKKRIKRTMNQIKKYRVLISSALLFFGVISCIVNAEKNTPKPDESDLIDQTSTVPNVLIPELSFIDYKDISSPRKIQWREVNRRIDRILDGNLSREKIEFWNKKTEIPMLNASTAWQQLKQVYPDISRKINMYTEAGDFYIFSLPHDIENISPESYFNNVVYTQKGKSEFWTISTKQ